MVYKIINSHTWCIYTEVRHLDANSPEEKDSGRNCDLMNNITYRICFLMKNFCDRYVLF